MTQVQILTRFESSMNHVLFFVHRDDVNEKNAEGIENSENDAIGPKSGETDNPSGESPTSNEWTSYFQQSRIN